MLVNCANGNTLAVHKVTVISMLNKNSLPVKKVRGHPEATMVISNQKL